MAGGVAGQSGRGREDTVDRVINIVLIHPFSIELLANNDALYLQIIHRANEV